MTRDVHQLYGKKVNFSIDYEKLKATMKQDFVVFLTTIPRHDRTSENLVAVLSSKLSAKSKACFPTFSHQVLNLLVPLPLRHMLILSKIHPLGQKQWSKDLFANITREYDPNPCPSIISFHSFSSSTLDHVQERDAVCPEEEKSSRWQRVPR
jgi:hypothetical protein